MGINLSNFLASKSHDRKMGQYQDLDHLDGLAISSVSANLYNSKRDDLAMFYFRDGANFASLYTQSKILSENIKWNLSQKTQKIFSLIVNTRNANSFTGESGYKSMQHLADLISKQLTEKQKEDEDDPKIRFFGLIILGSFSSSFCFSVNCFEIKSARCCILL